MEVTDAFEKVIEWSSHLVAFRNLSMAPIITSHNALYKTNARNICSQMRCIKYSNRHTRARGPRPDRHRTQVATVSPGIYKFLNNISLYYYKNNFQSIYPSGLYIVYVRTSPSNKKMHRGDGLVRVPRPRTGPPRRPSRSST